MTDPSIVAQGYDAVYDAMPRSPTLLRLWKQLVAGDDYPDDFYHSSFITLQDLRQLAEALNLPSGSTFADVACGMGGPALWIARETGAHLSGVDLSPVAVAQAEKRAQSLGLASNARFSVGSFAHTGLDTASMDAAMTVDALQYAPDKTAALREFARIIRPGGALAFFAFELHPERTRALPVIGDDPVDDYRPLLHDAGFEVLQYDQTPAWHDRLFTAYRAVIEAQDALRQEMGEIATAAILSEMTITLDRDIYSGRVFAVARRNSHPS
jgi:ubiquinone/menaquinone biosynthesis C-methylase UbiE